MSKVYNPHTGRYVKKNGKIGKKLLGGSFNSNYKIPMLRVSPNYKGGAISMQAPPNPNVADWRMNPLNAGYNNGYYQELLEKKMLENKRLEIMTANLATNVRGVKGGFIYNPDGPSYLKY